MPRKKTANRKGGHSSSINIGEEVRIAVKLQLKKFLADPSATGSVLLSFFFCFILCFLFN